MAVHPMMMMIYNMFHLTLLILKHGCNFFFLLYQRFIIFYVRCKTLEFKILREGAFLHVKSVATPHTNFLT
jgi:hypothetical protein